MFNFILCWNFTVIYITLSLLSLAVCPVINEQNNDSECGGTYAQDKGVIATPNYPNSYPVNKLCEWTITVSHNNSIKLSFNDFYTFESDYLKVYNGPTVLSPLLGAYSNKKYPRHLISSSNQLHLVFNSGQPRKGFNITYEIVKYGCGGEFTANESVIYSPGYPDSFDNITCVWNIVIPGNMVIYLSFNDFNMDGHHSICNLTLYQPPDINNSTILANFSGKTVPDNMIIRDNKLLIKYTSGYQCFSRHFSISYKSKLMGIGPPLIISATNAIVITNGNQLVENISYHSYNYYPIIDYLIERRASINAPAHNIAYLVNHGLIYWIDSVSNSINMMDINYPHLAYTILQLTSGFARDLRINTMSEVLVWCEIGFNAGLWESRLDGTNRTAIYANPKHRQPFHLTVDYRQKRYYFVDITDSSLYSVDFGGGHETYYLTSRPLLSSAVLGMNIFDDDLYLATDHVIYRIREPAMGVPEAELLYITSGYDKNLDDKNGYKFYNTNPTDIKRDKIYEFNVIDLNGRPMAKNRCSAHSCRHVCVPSGQSYSCLTPDQPMPLMNDPSEPVVSPLIMNTCNSVDILSIINTIVIAFMILLIVGLYLSVKKIVLTIEKRLFQVIIPTVTFKRVGAADDEDPPRKRLPEDHDYENNDRNHDYEIIDHDKRESG